MENHQNDISIDKKTKNKTNLEYFLLRTIHSSFVVLTMKYMREKKDLTKVLISDL